MSLRVQRHFISVDHGFIAVGPVVLALSPRGNMLADEVVTQLPGLIDVCESSNTTVAGWVVDRDQALPKGHS